jgi:hypothetical protein
LLGSSSGRRRPSCAGRVLALLAGRRAARRVVVAAASLRFKRLPALNDLWDASYGRLLLVKLGLVCLALAGGAFHHFVVRPRLDRSHGRRPLRWPARSRGARSSARGGDPRRLEAAAAARRRTQALVRK